MKDLTHLADRARDAIRQHSGAVANVASARTRLTQIQRKLREAEALHAAAERENDQKAGVAFFAEIGLNGPDRSAEQDLANRIKSANAAIVIAVAKIREAEELEAQKLLERNDAVFSYWNAKRECSAGSVHAVLRQLQTELSKLLAIDFAVKDILGVRFDVTASQHVGAWTAARPVKAIAKAIPTRLTPESFTESKIEAQAISISKDFIKELN